uniref:Glycolipid transfer protein n=1 Tax=Equus caballus TaxID=9796 RepID=F7A437_HORSE
MALLAEHLLKPLPADKQIETGPFLEAVSHLPPFFEASASSRSSSRASVMGSGTRTTPTSSASTPPRPTRWPSRSTTAGWCRRSSRQRCTRRPTSPTS